MSIGDLVTNHTRIGIITEIDVDSIAHDTAYRVIWILEEDWGWYGDESLERIA